MKVEITTPARKVQKLMDTPSAVFVILPDDIRRAGARSIAEALRMSPGLQVAQLDANKWAISSRGFNGRFSNKLLVLMDGRSVYSPISAGVFWDVQDTMLEDIERIEVIRGPGATLWGSNAVNGVINIITKPASHTQGGYGEAGVGTEQRDFAGARYGGPVGEGGHYRAYAKYLNHDGYGDGQDDWFMARAGFRTDWKASDFHTITVLGDVYDGEVGERVTIPTLTPPFSETFSQHVPVQGANVLARWTLDTGRDSRVSAQMWLETATRLGKIVDERRDTVDGSVDHRFSPGPGHDVVWGGEFRFTRDNIDNSETVQFNPTSRDAVIASAFLQDEITIIEEHLRFIFGAKVEYNTFSRRSNHPVEFQPSVRLAWTPDPAHALWASASRAVRTPSRGEADARANIAVLPGPTELALISHHDFDSEELIALEMGYRIQPLEPLTIDIAGFYNLYEDLRTFEPGTPFLEATPPPLHSVVPLDIDNRLSGRTYGIEVSIKAQPLSGWRLQAAYTFLRMNLIPEDSLDPAAEDAERESPRSQFYLRSSWDLPENVQLDVIPRYVGVLSALDVEPVKELDARLSWRPRPNVEIALTGQNLLHRRHLEFEPSILTTEATEVERGGYLMITVRF